MTTMFRVLLPLVLAFSLAGCAAKRVATQPAVPPLTTPAPPPRVVAPPEPEEAPPPTKTAEPPARKAARPPVRTETREAPKTEPQQPPVAPVTPPPVPEPQAGTLQTAKPGELKQLEGQVRAVLNRASEDLNARVDKKRLNADGRGQYDTAKRFIDQAQQALREQNFVLAQTLADKAATMAAALVNR